MNDKKEKPSLLRTVIEATIPLAVGYLLAVVVQFFTMESVIVNVSSSVELNEQYLTIVSVQNLKAKTLSKLSIYIDSEADVLNIKSDNEYKWEDQYIKFDSIAPKSENDIVIWTEQPIEKKQIVAESDYKTRVSYSQGRTPFIIQILGVLLTAGGVIIFGTSCSLWISKKQLIKVQNDIDEFQKKFEKLSKDIDNKKKQWILTTKRNNWIEKIKSCAVIIWCEFQMYKKNYHSGVIQFANYFTIARTSSKRRIS